MYGGGASEKLLVSVLSGTAMGGAPDAVSTAWAYSLYGGGFKSLAGERKCKYALRMGMEKRHVLFRWCALSR